MIVKKLKYILLILGFFSLLYVVIFSVRYFSSKNEIKEIYFADRMTAAHKIIIERYNKLMEGKVKVIPIDFPNDDFSTNERKEILARSLRGTGDGIDLFAVDLIWIHRFAKWCEPLDKYFHENDKKRILSNALESSYYDGEMVAVPLDLVQGILYYREDLLKKTDPSGEVEKSIKKGLTWEEFIKIGQKFKLQNPFFVFPAADYEGLICSFMEMILSLKPDYFQVYGFYFDTPEAAKALQLLVDLVHKHKLTPEIVTTFTEIPSYKYFINSDALFIRGWPSYDKDFQASPFDPEKEKHLKKAYLPYFENGNKVSIFGGWSLMVSKFSNKKEEVVDFIKFLLTDESQELFYKESGYFPIIKKLYEDKTYIKKYPEMIEIRELIKTGQHRPAHIEYTKYSEIMSFYFEQAIKKKIPVKDALNKASSAIQVEVSMIKE